MVEEMLSKGNEVALERLFSLISENLGPCGVVKLTPQGRMSERATSFPLID